MTSANTDSWTRDPVADANPDLPRKRERLSEEAETSPLSAGESVVVEALPPDDEMGTSYDNAIELHDEPAMVSFIQDFALQPDVNVEPPGQLQHIIGRFENGQFQDPMHIHNLMQWVNYHVASTQDSPELWREGYLEDLDFFTLLAKACLYLFDCAGDVFDTATLPKHDVERIGQHLVDFHQSITDLSIRMLAILPGILDKVTARRDSGQVPKTRQNVQLLLYVQVLAQTVAMHRAQAMYYFRETFHLKPVGASKKRRTTFMEHPTASSDVVAIMQKLARHQSDLLSPWEAIDAVLRLVCHVDLGARKDLNLIMDTAHSHILPIICHKHPRALPEGFHDAFVLSAGDTLLRLANTGDIDTIAVLYDRYIKSDHDALLPEKTVDVTIPKLLQNMCNHDQGTLSELISNAWVLQALKDFIYSDIMDVRSNGISQLSQRLLNLYNTHRTAQENVDHPVLQYVARFMRTNELTKYIFGPNSHASLVNHSNNIIGFLAATFAYTDLETDIIWHACTNSVEAEFVKASFGVLVDLSKYLDLDHLLYLANKYAITPAAKLGKDAIDSLTDLFQKVQIKSGESRDQRHRLATAFISIDIMMGANEADHTQALLRLREIARNELYRFTDPSFSGDDRLKIYERCIPSLLESDEHASTSIDILLVFVKSLAPSTEAQELLAMLPAHAVVDELGRYVDAIREGRKHQHLGAVAQRMELIVRLWALAGRNPSDEEISRFYRYTMGDLAWTNTSRDHAWAVLTNLAKLLETSQLASSLLRRLLETEAKNLPLHFVTPQLVSLYGMTVSNALHKMATPEQFSTVFETAMWRKLVEFAGSTGIAPVDQLATNWLCDILFDNPQRQFKDCSPIAKFHADFARLQIDQLCEDFRSVEKSSSGPVCQKLGLLDAILAKSRQYANAYYPDQGSEICLSSNPKEELVQYTLQLYGNGNPQPKTFQIQASQTTTLSQLANKLPSITGAVDNRLIVAGKLLDLKTDLEKPLTEVGLRPSNVIMLCPKHSKDSDLDVVLTHPGAVEREVLEQYDQLEKLLEGPEDIASKMYSFLKCVRPPAHVRGRIASPATSITELCPASGIWRCLFSFDILHTLLKDFARVGVANVEFIKRGVDLLVAVIIDEDRPLRIEVINGAICCLIAFLQELPQDMATTTLINEPARLATRLIDICFFALQQTEEQNDRRRLLVENIFGTMIQAFRRENAVWEPFTQDARTIELLGQVLFDVDKTMSSCAAGAIQNLCLDLSAPDVTADFFLKAVLALLPQALGLQDRATLFFDLATEVMFADRLLNHDEGRVRDITASLITTLWGYAHTESIDLPVRDMAASGLLRLITGAINMLKGFKKPLQLQNFALRLLTTLLVPAHKDPASRPLVNQHSRRLVYDLVKSACETPEDFNSILDAVYQGALQVAPVEPTQKYPGEAKWIRPADRCSGLPNLGMTCYMNSLIQQLFANVHFRKFVFDTPIVDRSRQILLDEVQKLFANMQDSYSMDLETAGIARVLGIQTDSQEDVHGFYEDFLSRLESNMPDEISKKRLSQFFTGKLIQQIKGECGHVSPQSEPFVDLPVVVKNKTSLSESLEEYVQGEPMEGANRYKCQACETDNGGKLVNAMKRACPDELPDNLTFCLKRFTYESMVGIEGKVNDRFEFPQSIDMSEYVCAQLDNPDDMLEDDVFELVGVIVHQGTLHLGHYWSYTLLRNTARPESRTWVKLEDRNASVVLGGVEEVQRECFGGLRYTNGNERADNAYVLFYERKNKLEEVIALPGPIFDPVSFALLPPKVAAPQHISAEIRDTNAWRHRIAHIFDDDFHSFAIWLITAYPQFKDDTSSATDPESHEDAEASSELVAGEAGHDLLAKMTKVAAMYIQRISVCDSAPTRRTREFLEKFAALVPEQPRFAVCLLRELLADADWLSKVTGHDAKGVRSLLNTLLMDSLKRVREIDQTLYHEQFHRLKTIHSGVLRKSSATYFNWAEYLRLAGDLARLGPEETAHIMDQGYWNWVFETFLVPFDASLRKMYPDRLEIMNTKPESVSALYEFVVSILSGHADGSAYTVRNSRGGSYQITDAGVLLSLDEMNDLLRCNNQGKFQGITYWMRASRHAAKYSDWRDFAPGKLLGLVTSKIVPQQMFRAIESSLQRHVDVEDDNLAAIMALVMHYCSNCALDHRAVEPNAVFGTLIKVLPAWDCAEKELTTILPDAHRLVPGAVVGTLPSWILTLLQNKSPSLRETAAKWLETDVFKDKEPIQGPPELDIQRCNSARRIVAKCLESLQSAFDSNRMRGRFEASISAVENIELYLQAWVKEAKDILGNEKKKELRAKFGPALGIELQEANKTLTEIVSVWADCVDQWPADAPISTTLQEVRQSLELVSDDPVDSSEDWEEDDESLNGR